MSLCWIMKTACLRLNLLKDNSLWQAAFFRDNQHNRIINKPVGLLTKKIHNLIEWLDKIVLVVCLIDLYVSLDMYLFV